MRHNKTSSKRIHSSRVSAVAYSINGWQLMEWPGKKVIPRKLRIYLLKGDPTKQHRLTIPWWVKKPSRDTGKRELEAVKRRSAFLTASSPCEGARELPIGK